MNYNSGNPFRNDMDKVSLQHGGRDTHKYFIIKRRLVTDRDGNNTINYNIMSSTCSGGAYSCIFDQTVYNAPEEKAADIRKHYHTRLLEGIKEYKETGHASYKFNRESDLIKYIVDNNIDLEKDPAQRINYYKDEGVEEMRLYYPCNQQPWYCHDPVNKDWAAKDAAAIDDIDILQVNWADINYNKPHRVRQRARDLMRSKKDLYLAGWDIIEFYDSAKARCKPEEFKKLYPECSEELITKVKKMVKTLHNKAEKLGINLMHD